MITFKKNYLINFETWIKKFRVVIIYMDWLVWLIAVMENR